MTRQIPSVVANRRLGKYLVQQAELKFASLRDFVFASRENFVPIKSGLIFLMDFL